MTDRPAMPSTRAAAQARIDRIAAFRDELLELASDGVVVLDEKSRPSAPPSTHATTIWHRRATGLRYGRRGVPWLADIEAIPDAASGPD